MTDTRKDLPPTGSANFLEKVREALSTYLGGRGDRLDRGLTVRDLYETGIIDLQQGFLKGGGGYSPVKGPGFNLAPAVVVKDLTPPPTPTGFAVSAGISHILIQHDAPIYTPGHGHSRTIVYGLTYTTGALPVFANAVKITEFPGSVFAHPSQPSTEWHLWIKWLSNDDVLSLIPAGGTNGLTVTTGQDVSTLLTALNGQLTSSQLNTALGARINLVDGPDSLAGSVNTRLAAGASVAANATALEAAARDAAIVSEALSRVNADTAEALSRSNAVTAESVARSNADAAETDARVNAVTLESIQRRRQVTANAEALLYNTLASNNVRLDASAATTVAKTELTNQFTTGILAEATSRLTLAAKLDTEKATTLGLITDESAARSTAVSAEATTRSLLATQFRGTYAGNDLTLLTEGLLYQERTTRTTQDNAMSQQITLLSAGAGEQFDWQTIWYFDNGSENWTGNGSPTAAAGFLRPANQATAAYVESPGGIATDGAKYTQTRMRVRKTGAPVWAAYLYWQATTDSTWDTTRRVALTQPTWDANGIGLVTTTAPWAGTINKIRVDLSAAQTGTDYYELDWVAVGRPSPGASSAQLLIEQTARVNADGILTSNVATLSAQVNNSTNGLPAAYAGLVAEQTARADADTAEAALRTTLAARVTTNEGSIATNASAISAEQTTRASADSTNASNTTALSSQVNDAATGLPKTRADLIVAQNTFASGATSFATDVRTLKSQSAQMSEAALKTILNGEAANAANKNSLALASQELRTNIVDGLSAEATARLALLAVVNANAATLTSEQLTRASADDAESAARVVLTARVTTSEGAITTNTANITSEQNARATADSALSTRVDAVVATATTDRTNTLAAITSEATSRAAADTAEASSRTTLAARVTTSEGGIITNAATIATESTTRATADTAISSRVDAVVATAGANTAAISSEATARTTADTSLGTRIDTVSASTGANTAAISSESTARATADTANASSISALSAQVNNVTTGLPQTRADLITEYTTRATADTALGTRVDTVVATATTDRGTATAAVQTEATARANADGTLFAQYTVKVDVNGYVSGFGLASTANNAGPSSAFAVRADQFYIASPSGPGVAAQLPFIVRTTATTINGVSVPVGVYMQDAFIQNGTITNAKIGNAQIDDAKIASLSASKITAGSIAVGSYIASTNYVAGSAGWTINGSGYAEFSNVVVRGGVYATTGQIGGNAINSTGLQSPGYSAGTSGWRLDSSGNLYAKSGTFGGSLAAASGTFAGSLQAATGTFSGNLSAAGGSFSGQLTANAINAVDTINIAGNAVTVAASASGSSLSTYLSMYLTAGQTVFVTCLVDGLASPTDVGGTFVYRFLYNERLGYLYLNGGLVRSVVSANQITILKDQILGTVDFTSTPTLSGVSQFTLMYVFTPAYTGYHSLEVRTTQATYWYYTAGDVYQELSTPASIFALQAKR